MARYSIILAGGSGTRLWPLSRKQYPKQFVKLPEFGQESLFQKAYLRALAVSQPHHICVVTGKDYVFHVQTQLEEINQKQSLSGNHVKIFQEPEAKNTLPAISIGMSVLTHLDDEAVIFPSDHILEKTDMLLHALDHAKIEVQTSLVLFGMKPSNIHTGYGYIEPKNPGVYSNVKRFIEKPNYEGAKKACASGCLWNMGIFYFSKKVFFHELTKLLPEFSRDCLALSSWEPENIFQAYRNAPDISIDYGMLEKTENIGVIPLSCYWNDLGSFDSLYEFLEHTKQPLHHQQNQDAKNNLSLCEASAKKVYFLGVNDIVIIDREDALLVTKRGNTQEIKTLVNNLKGTKEPRIQNGNTVYRPWGSYTIIDEGKGFKTKRLSVLPGKKLSLQMHYHRSEHWVVVSGTAQVTVGDNMSLLGTGESTFVPIGTKHRLENPGKTMLHLIESQIGDYLEEDDIVRFQDEFGRV